MMKAVHIYIRVAASILFFGLASGVVQAAENNRPEWRNWPLGQKLNLNVSAYRPKVHTSIAVGAGYAGNSIVGTLDFEENLGLEERKSVLLAGLSWRFAKRHSLGLDYFSLDRSTVAAPTVKFSIRLNDGRTVDFGGGAGLPEAETYVDIAVFDFGYEYSLIFDERKNWTVGIGLSWQEIDIGIGNPADFSQFANTDLSAPLPTFESFSDQCFQIGGFAANVRQVPRPDDRI